MTECAPKWRLFLFLLLGFFLAGWVGCSQLRRTNLDEEKEPHFTEGKKRAARFDWDGAIQSFDRALQVNPGNASAHLELGVIYDTKKSDYVSALYHYQRHLALRTNSPMADVVKQYMTACTRELAKTVQYAVVTREVQRDLERYEQTNSLLRKRVEFLEAEMSRRPQYVTNYITNFVGIPQVESRGASRMTQPTQPLQISNVEKPEPPSTTSRADTRRTSTPQRASPAVSRRETAPVTRTSPSPATSTPSRASHTVRPGETLASLAGRYGVSVQALRAANPGAANGVHAGQKINIPK